jgi:diguanylate cyclase (GGDEF)-like protein
MDEAQRPKALAARGVDGLLHAVVADVGESLDLWSVDLWAFSGDADTLECRAYWCRDRAAALSGDCMGAVVGLDQSQDLRRLVLAAEVVERHLGDDLSPADAAALTQAGFTSRIDVPLLAGAEVLGVLSLAETRAVRRLTPEERARLGTLARLAAAVLRATRLYEAENERAEHLVGLLVTGHGLSASLAAHEVVAAAREEAAKLVRGIVCDAEVVLRRDDGGFSRIAAANEGENARTELSPDAVARQAVDLGRPEQGRTADGRARLVLPLMAAERVAGYLEVTAPLKRQFRPAEIELASLLAAQTAAALERARAFRALQSRSATDTLTGLYSRWYFYERLYAEVARARRYRQPLALVVCEVDGEQDLTRVHGPAFRDAVLAAMARLLQTSLRDKVDVACRLGGGRFALLLPNTPHTPEAAGLVAERIRVRVASTRLSNDELGALGRFTMSLGVAGYPDAAEDADELASLAEERLAVARAAGGDRLEPPLPEPVDEDAEEDGAPEDGPA